MVTLSLRRRRIALIAICALLLTSVFAPALKVIASHLNKGEVFLVAANGTAYEFTNRDGMLTKAVIETALPVSKVFGRTSDGTRLLYMAAQDGLPTGKLYVENLTTKEVVQVTDKAVMSAKISPGDGAVIAFT